MKSWEDEQRKYLLSKDASIEAAAICLSGIAILCAIAVIVEIAERFFS